MTTSREGQQYYKGTGRRKCSIAQVRLVPGSGAVVINGKPLEEAVPSAQLQHSILDPFRVSNTQGKFNVMVKVAGGGFSSQAVAIRHGITRALIVVDEGLKTGLRKAGYVTRDPRVKERKKPGLKRARKAPQYTKR